MDKIRSVINVGKVNIKKALDSNTATKVNKINLVSNSSKIEKQQDSTSFSDVLALSLFLENDQKATLSEDGPYSLNSYSDKDNIYLNKLSDIMTFTKNDLGKENYKIYVEYLKGKKLSEICMDDDTLHLITDEEAIKTILEKLHIEKDASEVIAEINAVLQNSHFAGSTLSEEMKNSTIMEIASTGSGYDAFVLKDADGNYVIVNSCTNETSVEDYAAIIYTLFQQISGDEELFSMVFNNILPLFRNDDLSREDLFSELASKGTNYFKEINEGQLRDNKELIEKYASLARDENVKLELNGYSLGGGIQLAAYSEACIEDPKLEEVIESVSVFNPFLSFAEQQKEEKKVYTFEEMRERKDHPYLIQYLANSDKVRIYSGEGDMVSTFNTSIDELKDKFVFLHAREIEKDSVKDIRQLPSIILGGGSNHIIDALDQNYFDEKGNVTEAGQYISVLDLVSNAADFPSLFLLSNEYNTNYQYLMSFIMNFSGIQEQIDTLTDQNAKSILTSILNYLKNDIGSISYDGLTSSIANGCWEAIEENIGQQNFFMEGIANFFKDESVFQQAMFRFFHDEDTQNDVLTLISLIQAGDTTDASIVIYNMTYHLDQFYGEEIDSLGWAPGSKVVNRIIKDQFIESLRNALDGLVH